MSTSLKRWDARRLRALSEPQRPGRTRMSQRTCQRCAEVMVRSRLRPTSAWKRLPKVQRFGFGAESARLVAVLCARNDTSERCPLMHGDASQTRSGLRLVLSAHVSPRAASGRLDSAV